MTDPFDVLRRSVDSPHGASVEIDPTFRAELLDEARRRLSAAPGAPRRHVASTADIDARTEVIVMPVDQRTGWRRPVLLAAACVVLVTATVLAVTTLDRADVEEPAATAPVNATTTVPANATSVPTAPPLTDEQLIAAIRLDTADLGLSDDTWVEPFDYEVIDTDEPDLFDLGRYAARPECSAFDQVLEPLASSAHGLRVFGNPPNQPADQIVAVLPDAATAAAVFDGWTDPAFAPCLERYAWDSAIRFGARSEPPFAVSADDFAYYTFEQPTGQINAGGVVRVDRTLTFVGASITWFEPARPLMSEDAFGMIIDRVIARAQAALDGNPLPTATATPQPSASVSAAGNTAPTSG
jgi:hypothetical protein